MIVAIRQQRCLLWRPRTWALCVFYNVILCQAHDGSGHRALANNHAKNSSGQGKRRNNKGSGKGSHKGKGGKGKRKFDRLAQKDPYGGDVYKAQKKCYKCGELGHLANHCPDS